MKKFQMPVRATAGVTGFSKAAGQENDEGIVLLLKIADQSCLFFTTGGFSCQKSSAADARNSDMSAGGGIGR